jgi:hypothetical protein
MEDWRCTDDLVKKPSCRPTSSAGRKWGVTPGASGQAIQADGATKANSAQPVDLQQ